MSQPVLLDLTSLIAHPYRSGIQRVERETLRHWPDNRLIPCVLTQDGPILQLPPAIRDILCNQPNNDVAADRRTLATLLAQSLPIPPTARHILNLELFYEPWRAAAYRCMAATAWRIQWLVYDYLPWLNPGLFTQGAALNGMPYLQAIRSVRELAFISQQTRDDHATRIARTVTDPGPVLSLGADGLALERQTWSPNRRGFLVIGTIEHRKNPHLIAAAFRHLWSRDIPAPLIFAGRIDNSQKNLLQTLAADAPPNLLEIHDHPTDAHLRSLLRTARATLTASEIEGFGLPPYEALHAGLPAITAATLPSIKALPEIGHLRLSPVTPTTIAAAVDTLMDDATAERKWQDAATLDLPTWQDFAKTLSKWTE